MAGSLTRNLSFGDRPVCDPVSQTSGPSAARVASPRVTAISTSRAAGRFQYAARTPSSPSFSNPKLLTTGPSFRMRHLVSVGGEVVYQQPRHAPDAHWHGAVVRPEGWRVQATGSRARLDHAEPVVEARHLVGEVREVLTPHGRLDDLDVPGAQDLLEERLDGLAEGGIVDGGGSVALVVQLEGGAVGAGDAVQ